MPKSNVIHYYPFHYPPKLDYSIKTHIKREYVPDFLRELQHLISEKKGATFYYPDLEKDINVCRYEWHRKYQNSKYGIRIGLIINVTNDDIKEIKVYITTRKVLENFAIGAPKLSKILLKKIQSEVINLLQECNNRLDANNHMEYYIMFQINIPFKMGITENNITDDKSFKIFKTKIIKEKNYRISPIAIKVKSSCYHSGKELARNKLNVICALISLANGSIFKEANLSKTNKINDLFSNNINDFDKINIYPSNKDIDYLEKVDFDSWSRINIIWSAYTKLKNIEKETFKSALFAYNTALEINLTQKTLSIIPYISTLGLLAKPYQKRCNGNLKCSICGDLSFKHNIVGDKAAILELINDLLELDTDLKEKTRLMINRIYQKQRSSFVHSAKLRHNEYENEFCTPPAFPTRTKTVDDSYIYLNDLNSLRHLTRQILFKWLNRATDIEFDEKRFGISRFYNKASFENIFTIPGNVTLCIHKEV